MEATAYTYIVECADGTLYTGWTDDLEKRIRCHNAGRGAKYTRSRLPVRLVYAEFYTNKQDAMRREWEIKQLTRTDKLSLITRHTAPNAYVPALASFNEAEPLESPAPDNLRPHGK